MRLVAALALLLLSNAPAQPAPPIPVWNPRAPENSRILPAFSIQAIAPVLRAIGARGQKLEGDPKEPDLLVTFRNGRTAVLSFKLCEAADRCKALSVQSYWKPNPAVPPERTADAIQRFNQHYAFAKVFVTPDGRPSLQRYLTADYGIIRGNLAVNLLVFSEQAERFAVEFLEPLAKAK